MEWMDSAYVLGKSTLDFCNSGHLIMCTYVLMEFGLGEICVDFVMGVFGVGNQWVDKGCRNFYLFDLCTFVNFYVLLPSVTPTEFQKMELFIANI